MKHTLKNHRARMAAAGETGSNGGGLVVPEGKGGKAIGYIYRLVEAKVRCGVWCGVVWCGIVKYGK